MAHLKKADNHAEPVSLLNGLFSALELHDEEGRQLRLVLENLYPTELKAALGIGMLEKWDAITGADFGDRLCHEISGFSSMGEVHRINPNNVRSEPSLTRLPDRSQPNGETAPKQLQKVVHLEWLQIKADRLIRIPVIEKFDHPVSADEINSLAEYAKSLWPFEDCPEPEFHSNLRRLGHRICEQLPHSPEMLEKLFTSYDESSSFKSTDEAASQ